MMLEGITMMKARRTPEAEDKVTQANKQVDEGAKKITYERSAEEPK
jgi:hypothetical protein